jgi:hypothetical protein
MILTVHEVFYCSNTDDSFLVRFMFINRFVFCWKFDETAAHTIQHEI